MSVRNPRGPLCLRLVPDELWTEASRLIPPPKVRPQGGGRVRVDDRMAFVALVYVLTMDCPWRRLPPEFDVTVPTIYRRFKEFVAVDLFGRLHDAVSEPELKRWAKDIQCAANEREKKEL